MAIKGKKTSRRNPDVSDSGSSTGSGSGTWSRGSGGVIEPNRWNPQVDLPDTSGTSLPGFNPGTVSGNSLTGSDFFKDLFGLNDKTGTNTFQGLLGDIMKSTNNPYMALLALLMRGEENNLTNAQSADWNKQLLDQIINLMMEQEKRGYNESRLDEQRLYDNPQNQLSRLMGAGISRDAAIQLIGQSSEPIQSEGAESAQGVSPSQSLAAEADAHSKTLNTAFSAIGTIASAIGGLGTFGMSAAALGVNLAATKAATANTVLNNKNLLNTLNGIEVASSVIGALSSYQNSGKFLPEFKDVHSMVSFIRTNASGYEPFKALLDSGFLDKIPSDVYSLNALNDGYFAWRKTKDYNIDRSHIVRMQALNELRSAVDIKLVESEVSMNYENINVMIGQLINDNIRTDSLVAKNEAEIQLIGQQSEQLQLSNQILSVDAQFLGANADAINGMRLRQLMFDASCWQEFENDPEAYQNAIQGWLNVQDNAATAAALESIYLTDELYYQQNIHDPNQNSGHNLRDIALWFHNLTKTALNEKPASSSEIRQYGKFAKSAVSLYLLRNQ